jgi:hypothetical protein
MVSFFHMSKRPIIMVAIVVALAGAILFQSQTIDRLRRELATANEENAGLRQQGSNNHESAQQIESAANSDQQTNKEQASNAESNTRLQELQSEVMRLRGAAARAARAEAEVVQIQKQLEQARFSTSRTASTDNSGASPVMTYLGEAVQPPSNLAAAYTKDGLLSAIQDAARNAGISLKKVEIETSEFPFLCGVTCASEADFEKLKSQLKQMDAYEYNGSVSSHTSYAFNLVPYRTYPSDTSSRITRRTMLRQQMFFDQLKQRDN